MHAVRGRVSGNHCDKASALSQCHEFDCSNYGGQKSLAHCGGTSELFAAIMLQNQLLMLCDALTSGRLCNQ